MASPYSSQSAAEHRRQGPASVRCAVVTVSDTRTLENDTGGQAIVELLHAAGHQVVERAIVPDDSKPVQDLILALGRQKDIDAILITGGTGIAPRDHTADAIDEVLSKPLPGYGELFRMLSYQEIGPAAMLSRALGGLMGETVVLTMPGSPAAVRLAIQRIILPELGHLVALAQS
jgi:molybdenum cofactor biosynthesis protein B